MPLQVFSSVQYLSCVLTLCGRTGFNSWVGKIPWRRKRQSTPVFLPGESHGRRSLVEGDEMDFPVAQMAKNLPERQETQVQFLGREDPLQKEMATHSSILAWRTPWTEEPGRLQSMGSQQLDMAKQLNHHHHHQEPPANAGKHRR